MDYLTAVLLGAVQGVTEFLPISSSGHLALGQRLLDLDPDSTPMLLFDVLAHLGTLIAVAVVFAAPALRYLRRLLLESNRRWTGRRYAWRIAFLGMAAVIPTAVIGFSFKDTFEAAFDKPSWIAVCLIITGVLLAATKALPRGRRGWGRFTWWQAALVGVAQAGAILPGISRSGSTICVAAYCGLRRRWAAEFSFLIVSPVICGVTLLNIRETTQLAKLEPGAVPWGPILVGSLVANVSTITLRR